MNPFDAMNAALLAGPLAMDVYVGSERRLIRAFEGGEHGEAFGLMAVYKKWIEVDPQEDIPLEEIIEVGGSVYRVQATPFIRNGIKVIPLEAQ